MNESLAAVMASLGVDPQLYGAVSALGVINAVLKARVVQWQPWCSALLAVVFGGVLGAASAVAHANTVFDGCVHAVILVALALGVEFGLEFLGVTNNSLLPSVPPSAEATKPPAPPVALLVALLALCVACAPARAGIVDTVYLGGGGAWYDANATAFPSDLEAHGGASASLSPHLSAVGDLDYGFAHSYFRYQGGVRVTATDVANPDFNTFLEVCYRGASKPEVSPNEWAPGAGFGWRAFKSEWPAVLITGDASYGLTSKRVIASLGVRYSFPIRGF